jgi:ribonuclease R
MARKRMKKANADLLSSKEIQEIILGILSDNAGVSLSLKNILQQKEVNGLISKYGVLEALEHLIANLKVKVEKNGNFIFAKPVADGAIVGTVDHVNSRFAFVVIGEDRPDIWVKTEDLNGAVDGDQVLVNVFHTKSSSNHSKRGNEKRLEGEVVEIVHRKREEFVGKLQLSPRFGFVIPDGKKIHFDIFVYNENLNGAVNGDKVAVKILDWPKPGKNPVGKITKVLGQAGENDTEMNAIMMEFGLPTDFPEEVEAEAEAISDVIAKEEIKLRKDFRKITTFTIDPEDAKDFDDALSLQKLPNGNWEVGVHIADVTHYVTPGTALEKEAFIRATSVYLVDRCVPMLPEKLSNGLCSLRPHEDKLTFSAVFELDENAEIQKEWFGRTIIHSDRRFSYEEVQEIIEKGEGEFSDEIKVLNALAYKLRDAKFKNGAIGFETAEVKFKLDDRGVPLAVIPKVRKDAHRLIEDFMLLANKRVAEFVYHKNRKNEDSDGLTMVYRTHDSPNSEKLQSFAVFAGRFGRELSLDTKNIAHSLNKLVHDIEGSPEENVLQNLAIRTMSKAKYTTEEAGHFGLAFDHYTHFTSPIRRYPDMMAHRLLQRYLDGKGSAPKEEIEEECKHASDREKLAAEAERSSIKYKQVQYMQMMEKRPFSGIVSGVTEWGAFVEIIETKCEGMVRMSDMKDDYYELDAKNYRLIGRDTGKEICLGDTVIVEVKGTDLDKRTIDLEFVGQTIHTIRNRANENGSSKRGNFKDKGSKSGRVNKGGRSSSKQKR